MPSILNATTTSGLVTSADNSGSLQLQTNNGTTALTIDTSQNVGIGTSSPGSQKLHVRATSPTEPMVRAISVTPTGNGVYGQYNAKYDGTASDWYFGQGSTGAWSFWNNDGSVNERMRLTSDGNLQFNSGYGSVATAYGCRAWVTFNGSDTPTIRASGNVSSITDFGVGDYRINFTTNMVDTNYTIVGSSIKAGGAPSGDNSAVVIMGESPSVSGAGVGLLTVNGGALDRGYVYAAVFR